MERQRDQLQAIVWDGNEKGDDFSLLKINGRLKGKI